MKWYVVMYEYARVWHVDVLCRSEKELDTEVAFQYWFVEAIRLSIERLGLRKEGSNVVPEAKAYEISCIGNNNKMEVVVGSSPVISEKHIELI